MSGNRTQLRQPFNQIWSLLSLHWRHLHIHHMSRILFLILSFLDFVVFVVRTRIFPYMKVRNFEANERYRLCNRNKHLPCIFTFQHAHPKNWFCPERDSNLQGKCAISSTNVAILLLFFKRAIIAHKRRLMIEFHSHLHFILTDI